MMSAVSLPARFGGSKSLQYCKNAIRGMHPRKCALHLLQCNSAHLRSAAS